MEIQKNYDLTKLNTLGVSAHTSFFTEIHNEIDLKELLNLKIFKEKEKVFLGGGSNILFTKDFNGIVILNKLKGIKILEENNDSVLVRSMSGENWDDFVNFTVDKKLWGIENLAFIPGTVGAGPVQNIGAYGVELKDSLENVETFDIRDGSKRIFTKEECEFGYRDSVFKSKLKGQYFISSATFKLSKIPKPNFSYKILSEYIKEKGIISDNPKNISIAVEAIRRSKLPDPIVIGNAGSFFKNVFLDEIKLKDLIEKYPEVKYFKEGGNIKVPAGWLIEQCGWKGKRLGNVGVHTEHALILVNYGGGKGEEVKDLADEISNSVFLKFGLKLVPEVNFI